MGKFRSDGLESLEPLLLAYAQPIIAKIWVLKSFVEGKLHYLWCLVSTWWDFTQPHCNCFLQTFDIHMVDVNMQVMKMLEEFSDTEEDWSVLHRHALWMMMESVEEDCHSDGTPNHRDCEKDVQMHLTLPLQGVGNGNAGSESSVEISSIGLCSRHMEEYLANRWSWLV